MPTDERTNDELSATCLAALAALDQLERYKVALASIEAVPWHDPRRGADFNGDPEVFRLKAKRMFEIARAALNPTETQG